MYTILFFKKKMAAKLLGIMFMFRAGEREKGSIPCDNPHLSGQQHHQNPHQSSDCVFLIRSPSHSHT